MPISAKKCQFNGYDFQRADVGSRYSAPPLCVEPDFAAMVPQQAWFTNGHFWVAPGLSLGGISVSAVGPKIRSVWA